MCYRKYGAVLELPLNGLLYDTVCLQIHIRCRLVEDDDLVSLQQSASQTEKLTLARAEVRSTISDFLFQLVW